MTVTITQDVRDIAGVPEMACWYFSAPVLRQNGSSIIAPAEVRVSPVDGVLTVDLEPGLARVRFNNASYVITVPETDSDLWSLIASGVASPPSVSGAALDAAIAAYLEANGGGGGGDVVDDTTPQLGGNLDVNGHNVGAAVPADLTALHAHAAALALLSGPNTGDQDLSGYATSAAVASAISTAVNGLVNGAPGALDTLKELADALNDDASFAATVNTALAARVQSSRTVNGHALSADVTVSKADVGLGNVDNVSEATILTAAAAAALPFGTNYAENLATGFAALPRLEIGTSNIGLSTGVEHFTYFTAPTTKVITKYHTFIGGNASSSATISRVGIYSVATNGDLTLIGSTPNLTTLWSAGFSDVNKALSASVTLTAGVRYAVGLLYVGTGNPPFLYSALCNGLWANSNPALCTTLAAQTDLATSTTLAAMGAAVGRFYSELLT